MVLIEGASRSGQVHLRSKGICSLVWPWEVLCRVLNQTVNVVSRITISNHMLPQEGAESVRRESFNDCGKSLDTGKTYF